MLCFQRHSGEAMLRQEPGSLHGDGVGGGAWQTCLWNRPWTCLKGGFFFCFVLFCFKTLPISELEHVRTDRLVDPGMVREIHFCGGKASCKIEKLCWDLSPKKVKQNILTTKMEFEHLHVGKGHQGWTDTVVNHLSKNTWERREERRKNKV